MKAFLGVAAVVLLFGCSDPCREMTNISEAQFDLERAVEKAREEEQRRAAHYREFVEGEMYSIVTAWQEEEISSKQAMKEIEVLYQQSGAWKDFQAR